MHLARLLFEYFFSQIFVGEFKNVCVKNFFLQATYWSFLLVKADDRYEQNCGYSAALLTGSSAVVGQA